MTKTKNLIITGANRGIGLSLAAHYKKQGWQVTAIVRTTSDALDKVADQVIKNVEMDGDIDTSSLLKQVDLAQVDLLMNVAGMMQWESLDELNADVIRRQLEVNMLAPLMLTQGLLPLLSETSKVAFLTSRLGSISDNNIGSGYGYRVSKTALNMAVKTLAIDLKKRGIAVGLFHPGSVKTSLNKLGGEIDVSESVAGIVKRVEELSIGSTGHFLHQNGQTLSW